MHLMTLALRLLPFTVLVLLACASPAEQYAAEQQRLREAQADQNRRAAEYDRYIERLRSVCAQYGYRPGTEAFARCVQAEVSKGQAASQRDAAVASCKQAMFLRPKRGGGFCRSKPVGAREIWFRGRLSSGEAIKVVGG